MPFALELSDNVDPTALATVLLALLTFATVVVGGLALRRTRSEIDLSRREVEEAHRPVLIPVFNGATPRYEERYQLVLPIKNIGMGPALNITVWVVRLDSQGNPLDWQGKPARGGMGNEPKWWSSPLLGLGVLEMTAVTVYITGLEALTNFGLAITYVDVAEKRWITKADYFVAHGGVYESMSINESEPPSDAPPARLAA